MKRNILYLIGLIFVGTMFMGCDSDDDEKYSDLILDTELLVIDLDNAAEANVRIVQGNGNYKLSLSNDKVATVAISDNNTIHITGLETGKAELIVTDWAKKATQLQIVVKKLEELLLEKSAVSLVTGEVASMTVFSGNGEYAISSSDETVAKGTIDEDGNIAISALTRGSAVLSVTDAKGKSAEVQVNVRKPLILSQTEEVYFMTVGEILEVDILEGNGGYTATASSSLYFDVSLNDTKVLVKGKRYGKANTTITIKDEEGSSANFKIVYIDDTYLDNINKYRYFVDENSPSQYATGAGQITHSADFNLSQIYAKSSTSSYASGFGVRFTGDLSVGSKTNAQWFKIASGKINESTLAPATDLRIDKVEDGWYWVSFMTEGKSLRSYIVTK